MPVTERIVIDADPSIKKMLSELSKEYDMTMKAVACNLIESKYKELQLKRKTEVSKYFINSKL